MVNVGLDDTVCKLSHFSVCGGFVVFTKSCFFDVLLDYKVDMVTQNNLHVLEQ